jgi:uncharacterized membrane protein
MEKSVSYERNSWMIAGAVLAVLAFISTLVLASGFWKVALVSAVASLCCTGLALKRVYGSKHAWSDAVIILMIDLLVLIFGVDWQGLFGRTY